ncbi:TetR/AcrR family transcriptional regulator [Curtanaerobium respiraculi]|uniref:TetR/AcrR family transcriptional regulator n=1 Tax=Curtanaerobium respiraculi TaxID=2949669 RepID=UPI0024B36720|nr:TetR/AcrR family transcriptional regulator [Curtanaerobium respiraculi]
MAVKTMNGAASRERILDAARGEFAEKGFEKASLRVIAQKADLTTGAIYGYFSTKQDLFNAIVAPAANELLSLFESAQRKFYEQPFERQGMEDMLGFTLEVNKRIVSVLYDNRDAFLLVLEKAGGTPWADYVERFVEIEAESTTRYVDVRNEGGDDKISAISDTLARTLARSYFACLFEVFRLEPAEADAFANMQALVRFYHRGYEALFEDA